MNMLSFQGALALTNIQGKNVDLVIYKLEKIFWNLYIDLPKLRKYKWEASKIATPEEYFPTLLYINNFFDVRYTWFSWELYVFKKLLLKGGAKL